MLGGRAKLRTAYQREGTEDAFSFVPPTPYVVYRWRARNLRRGCAKSGDLTRKPKGENGEHKGGKTVEIEFGANARGFVLGCCTYRRGYRFHSSSEMLVWRRLGFRLFLGFLRLCEFVRDPFVGSLSSR